VQLINKDKEYKESQTRLKLNIMIGRLIMFVLDKVLKLFSAAEVLCT